MLVLVRHLCSYLETVSGSSVMRQTTPESASCRAKCSIEGSGWVCVVSGKLFVYNVNSVGQSLWPWGTPACMEIVPERWCKNFNFKTSIVEKVVKPFLSQRWKVKFGARRCQRFAQHLLWQGHFNCLYCLCSWCWVRLASCDASKILIVCVKEGYGLRNTILVEYWWFFSKILPNVLRRLIRQFFGSVRSCGLGTRATKTVL